MTITNTVEQSVAGRRTWNVHAAPARAGRFRPSPHSWLNRASRATWAFAWLMLFRPSPRPAHGWRRFLLRSFGAHIGRGATVHASARIWAPWNLEMGEFSCLGAAVDCYSADHIRIGARATVSQYSFLCTASHDIDSAEMTLITAPITIGEHAWVAANAFIAPGVSVGAGAVVGARASVFRDVEPWTVVAGNPARTMRQRSRAVAERATHGGLS